MITPSPRACRALGQRTFTQQDQLDFAVWSGDCNPMHVDAIAARRLLSGRQVVHGIHTLLCALDLWARSGPVADVWIDCRFAHPVSVGDAVEFSLRQDGDGLQQLVASVDGLDCTEISLGAPRPAGARTAAGPMPAPRMVGGLTVPLDEKAGSQAGQTMRLVLGGHATLMAAFGHAAAAWGAARLSAVAGLSYLVGMVCPGMHSVFSSASFDLARQPVEGDEPLDFVVQRYDPRFKLFSVDFNGPIHGSLRAFQRPPPQLQPSAADVAAKVAQGAFADPQGSKSLVIGGSRGLGETAAKILAAGGADVVITYAAGRDDAQAVVADIAQLGRGSCEAVHFDLLMASDPGQVLSGLALQEVYYFATPRIYAKRSAVFERRMFDEFVDFYLQRFHQLCVWLDATERPQPLKVYLPSTVFIAERPKGMTEYAMVKAAAEVLADDLNRQLRNVQVVHTRLPRLATDQTASILQVSVGSNVDVLLEVVRAMRA